MTTTLTDDRSGDEAPEATGTARWARLASTGFAFEAVGPLLMLGAGLAWGLDVGGELPFFLGAAGAAVVAAALVRRRSTAARVVAIVLGVMVGMMLFWTAFGLSTPASVFDFLPGVLVLPGAVIGLVAGIGAIRSERRGRRAGGLEGTERTWVIGAVTVVVLAGASSAVLSLVGRDTVDDPSVADVVVDLRNFEFAEEAYEVEPGSTVLVRNRDPFVHTFTIDELGIDVSLRPGSERLVEIPSQPGSYVLYCTPHTGDREDPSESDMAASFRIS